jgi:ankyrin repeat protein
MSFFSNNDNYPRMSFFSNNNNDSDKPYMARINKKQAKQDKLDNALMYYSEIGDYIQARILINSGARDNLCNFSLRMASLHGHIEIVKQLLIAGGSITIVDFYQFTFGQIPPLYEKSSIDISIILGNMNLVKIFIQHEHDKFLKTINDLNFDPDDNVEFDDHYDFQQHVLVVAAEYGQLEIFKYSFETFQMDYLSQPIFAASKSGKIEILKFLHSVGINLAVEDSEALVCASIYGNHEVVSFLLEQDGIDVAAQGECSLLSACKNGHTETVKVLLLNGADKTTQNYTPLLYAIQNAHFEIVELLFDINVVSIGKMEMSPLLCACWYQQLGIVKLLINKGIDVNYTKSEYLVYSLSIASFHGNVEIVEFLLKMGAIVKLNKDISLRTAIEYKHRDIIRILLDYYSPRELLLHGFHNSSPIVSELLSDYMSKRTRLIKVQRQTKDILWRPHGYFYNKIWENQIEQLNENNSYFGNC